jgi:hypothetical protein
MTIVFLSLFFGLISGPYPVELAVNGPVQRVELLVDGRSVRTLQAPPWKAEVDFGPSLQPHEIVARALDAQGHEVARAEDWANLPHSPIKVEIALEESRGGGPPKAAKVVWKDLKGETPSAIRLTFDSLPLPLDPAGRAVLPAHDLRSLHILAAEVDFPSGRTGHADTAYGGEYGSAVATELTAVPVRPRDGRLPGAERLGGWLTAAGQPLTVAAVEEGPAQLYVVLSPSAGEPLLKLGLETREYNSSYGQLEINPLWKALTLGEKDEVRIVLPFSLRYEGSGEQSDLFDVLPGAFTRHDGFVSVLLKGRLRAGYQTPLRFADATAVAGLEATAENRRRVVLLLLSSRDKDQSRYDPERVRRYLAGLHVPLLVWCVGEPEPGSAAAAWGKVEVLKHNGDLPRVFKELRKVLDSQRIVMVDGRLLPQSIALSSKAAGVELAGATP